MRNPGGLVIILLLVVACRDGVGTGLLQDPHGSVEIVADSLIVEAGRTLQLSARVRDASHTVVESPEVTWSISDSAVAALTRDGVLAARRGGSVTVSARAGQVGATATVKITPSGYQGPVFVSVATGPTHACALTGEGAAYCWGEAAFGILGGGTSNPTATSAWVVGGLRFRSVSPGHYQTCGVTTDDRLYCWGRDHLDHIGSATVQGATPTPVASNLRFATVGMGYYYSCALAVGGTVYCWGLSQNGVLGSEPEVCYVNRRGERTYCLRAPTPVEGGRSFAALDVGWEHSCALDAAGEAYCWGSNSHGQLGSESGAFSPIPVRVSTNLRFSSLAAGLFKTCGLDRMGTGYCWGSFPEAQLQASHVPMAISQPPLFASVTAGYAVCGATPEGLAYCWGPNNFGQLGNGTRMASSHPTRVAGGIAFRTVATHGQHGCGISTAGQLFCRGLGQYYHRPGAVGTAVGEQDCTQVGIPARCTPFPVPVEVSARG